MFKVANFPDPKKPKTEVNGLSVVSKLIARDINNAKKSILKKISLYRFHHLIISKIVIALKIKAIINAIQRNPSLKDRAIAHNKITGITFVLFFSKIIQRTEQAINTKGRAKKATGAINKKNIPIGGTIIIKGAIRTLIIRIQKEATELEYRFIFFKYYYFYNTLNLIFFNLEFFLFMFL